MVIEKFKHLDLSINKINFIPNSIGHLTNLIHLELYYNSIDNIL